MIRKFLAQSLGVSKGIASNEVKNPITVGSVLIILVVTIFIIIILKKR